jgi:hypothetical protein
VSAGPRSIREVEVDPITRETVVLMIDQVGNVLTHAVKWCRVHVCPVLLHRDGSFSCWHDNTVGWSPHEHRPDEDIVAGPWEIVLPESQFDYGPQFDGDDEQEGDRT